MEILSHFFMDSNKNILYTHLQMKSISSGINRKFIETFAIMDTVEESFECSLIDLDFKKLYYTTGDKVINIFHFGNRL